MSAVAVNWAFKQRGISITAKLVLLHLADMHSGSHGCWPTNETLADVCEISKLRAVRALGELVRAGLATVEYQRPGHGYLPPERRCVRLEIEGSRPRDGAA